VEITEVRIKLLEMAGERLQAFCSITLDNSFVIRDLKIIEGANGPFVAMPSRKLTAHCPQCGCKNHLRAAYCNQCGGQLKEDRTVKDEDGRVKLYADIAHPIHSACREMIQERVVREFREELERAKQPGYVSSYDDLDPEDFVATSYSGAKTNRRDGHGQDRPAHSAGHSTNHPASHPASHPAAGHSSSGHSSGGDSSGEPRPAPANYVRSGSEPASQVQSAEPQPRPPHRIPAAQPAQRAAGGSTASNSDGAPVESRPSSSADEFGAGIF